MIGGTDVVFPALGDPASLEACTRLVGRYWPALRLEDAITGDKFRSVGEVPYGRVRELLIYPDEEAEAAWDADSPSSAENSMLYLIARPEDITVVVDDPEAEEMRSLLAAIHDLLCTHKEVSR